RIAHRIAADRDAVAVHHQEIAGAPERAVVGVRIAQVESEVELAARIELARTHGIETLRGLAITASLFRAERAGIRADRIAAEQHEAVVLAQPDLQHALMLEDADEYRIAE